jgi:hypothetical protein
MQSPRAAHRGAEEAVGLVGCAARKAPGRRRARDLYVSDLFRKASAYADRAYDRWFILSAKHGLVDPDVELEPYDVTLSRMGAPARRAWAGRVLEQIGALGLPDGTRFFLHAGARYREHLAPALRAETPLRGLGIGQQLRWYAERRPAAMGAPRPTAAPRPE